MNAKQKLMVGALVGAALVTSVYGVTTVKAETATTDFPPMIQKMVEKFNLNKSEVQNLMSEERVERQAKREADLEASLAKAVAEGKITEAQKAKILAKHEEIQAKRDSIRLLDRDEKRTEMQALRTEMQNLLKAEGIDDSVMPAPQGPRGGMGGRGQGFGGGMHRS